MSHTSQEIPLPGGVTIEFDQLVKAAKAGKSPDACVAAALTKSAPIAPLSPPAPVKQDKPEAVDAPKSNEKD